MARIADILVSRWFWEIRIVTATIAIIIAWSGVIMTSEMLIWTPVEYLPYLLIIGLIVTTFFTCKKAMKYYNDAVKKKLKSGEITEAPDYGTDYLASNIGVIIVGVMGAFIVPGGVYEILGATPDLAGCVAIALVWSLVVGVKGVSSFSEAVDLFHDPDKIADLEAQAKAKAEADTTTN